MPYFERRPFTEIQDLLAGRLQDVDSPGASAASSDLVKQAAAILQKESQSAPAWKPPVNTPAPSWPNFALPPGTKVMPVVLQAPPVHPGQQTRISIAIVNDSGEDVPYSFQFTDLISPMGERIPQSALRTVPDEAIVSSGSSADVSFEIHIPSVSPGPYFGLATCPETQPAILAVTVSV